MGLRYITQTNSRWFKECIDYAQLASFGLKYYSDKFQLTQILLAQSKQKLAEWGLCLRAMKIENESSIVGMFWYSHWFITYHTKIWEKTVSLKCSLPAPLRRIEVICQKWDRCGQVAYSFIHRIVTCIVYCILTNFCLRITVFGIVYF